MITEIINVLSDRIKEANAIEQSFGLGMIVSKDDKKFPVVFEKEEPVNVDFDNYDSLCFFLLNGPVVNSQRDNDASCGVFLAKKIPLRLIYFDNDNAKKVCLPMDEDDAQNIISSLVFQDDKTLRTDFSLAGISMVCINEEFRKEIVWAQLFSKVPFAVKENQQLFSLDFDLLIEGDPKCWVVSCSNEISVQFSLAQNCNPPKITFSITAANISTPTAFNIELFIDEVGWYIPGLQTPPLNNGTITLGPFDDSDLGNGTFLFRLHSIDGSIISNEFELVIDCPVVEVITISKITYDCNTRNITFHIIADNLTDGSQVFNLEFSIDGGANWLAGDLQTSISNGDNDFGPFIAELEDNTYLFRFHSITGEVISNEFELIVYCPVFEFITSSVTHQVFDPITPVFNKIRVTSNTVSHSRIIAREFFIYDLVNDVIVFDANTGEAFPVGSNTNPNIIESHFNLDLDGIQPNSEYYVLCKTVEENNLVSYAETVFTTDAQGWPHDGIWIYFNTPSTADGITAIVSIGGASNVPVLVSDGVVIKGIDGILITPAPKNITWTVENIFVSTLNPLSQPTGSKILNDPFNAIEGEWLIDMSAFPNFTAKVSSYLRVVASMKMI